MKVYLDVCCLNRPLDDQSQPRIRLEAEAVVAFLARIEADENSVWVSSQTVDLEIARTPDIDRRRAVQLIARHAGVVIKLEQKHFQRGFELEKLGIRGFDALHLACAESEGVDVFLTTDDRLLRTATRHAPYIAVRVMNPLDWIREVL